MAIYSGDATFVASTSDLTTDVTVDPASTAVTVTATVGTPSYVDPIPVTFTATVQRHEFVRDGSDRRDGGVLRPDHRQ